MESVFLLLVIFYGLVGFLSPCTWNLNVFLIANAKQKGYIHIFLFLFFRVLLFSVLGGIFYLISKFVQLKLTHLVFIHMVVAFFLFFGNFFIRRFKVAPIDFSLQALFPNLNVPAGTAIGLNFPYCAIPYFILLQSYGLYLDSHYPFSFSVLFAVLSGVPSLLTFFLSKDMFKKINEFIPLVPYISGFVVLIFGLYLFNEVFLEHFSLLDFVKSEHSFWVSVFIAFILGLLTSVGPSTLPFLPVVAGILVSQAKSKREVALNIFAFTLSFIIAHIIVAVVAFYGFVVVNKLFNVQLFNILLAGILVILGLNFIGIFNFAIRLPQPKVIKAKGFIGSFLLGLVYTFSICPSCTGFLLGAIALSIATENLILAVIVMVVYALGRSVVLFLLGFLFNIKSIQDFIRNNYILAKRIVGVIFIILSVYFLQRGL